MFLCARALIPSKKISHIYCECVSLSCSLVVWFIKKLFFWIYIRITNIYIYIYSARITAWLATLYFQNCAWPVRAPPPTHANAVIQVDPTGSVLCVPSSNFNVRHVACFLRSVRKMQFVSQNVLKRYIHDYIW